MEREADADYPGRAGITFIVSACLVVAAGIVTQLVVVPLFRPLFSARLPYILALFIWLFFLSIVIASLAVHMADRRIIPALWRNLRPFRTFHFVFMVVIGLVVAGNMNLLAADNLPFVIISIVLLVLIWQYTVMLNDIYDIEIDRLSNVRRPLTAGVVTRSQYFDLIATMAVLSILLGFLLTPLILSLTILCLILGTVYSVPPLRVRDRLWSSIIIGSGSACAFLIGFFTPDHRGMTAGLSMDVILIALIIFSALSAAPVLTDLKDYEGDRKTGVRSLYTVFGLEEGKRMASAMIPILFLTPALILHNIIDILIFVLFGAMATVLFHKKGDFRPVFGCYFVVLIYSILRITGLFSGGI